MESAEASGKTVEDALNRALAQLGASRDQVEFVVLDEGRKGGLFGRGARDAQVRVDRIAGAPGAAPAADPRPPRGAAPQRGGGGQRGRGDGPRPEAGRSEGSGDGRGGQRQRGAPSAGRGRPDSGRQTRTGFDAPAPKLTDSDFLKPQAYGDGEVAAPVEGAPPPTRAPRGQRPPRAEGQDRGDRRDRGDGGDRGDRGDRPPRDEERNIEPDINSEEVDFAAHVVDDILRLLDINAEITIREPLTNGDGKGVVRAVIDIGGENLGLLIGRRGDTLTSFQYLVNLIVTRRFPGKGGVSIDVEHYRHRREEQVVAMATRMADRVRQTGSPITLEPMTAAERRLVHMILAEDPELETNSIGEGDNRKVVISSRR